MHFRMKQKTSTFLKYVVSYVLIFSVLLCLFFLILRSQLTEAYTDRQADRIHAQMEAMSNHLLSEIQFLYQTDRLITENPDIKLATHLKDYKYRRLTHTELKQYTASAGLIDGIVYYSRYSDHIFSTTEYVQWKENAFLLTNGANRRTVFDPAPYLDASAGQLILLKNEETQYLLWFPVNPSQAKYLYFYILDTKVIQSQLKTLLSNEVLAVALLDGNGQYVTGSDFAEYSPLLTGKTPTKGITPMENGSFVYISKPIQDGYALAAVVSGSALKKQVNEAFLRSFLSMLGLSLVGLILVYVAMMFTYRPLQRLVKNLGHDAGRNQNYLELISRNYRDLMSQKAELEQALAEYRESHAQNAPSAPEELDYPHEELGNFTVCLREKRFDDVRELLDVLLSRFDSAPGYFLGCILLDCLTLISNSMSRAHIEFESYAELFTKTVHRCRDLRDIRQLEGVKALLWELLRFYEQQTLERTLQVAPLRQFVESRFCDPDFSIAELAETYHLSTSRMSSLFKAEMGVGFLDYVWSMRLQKGQQLLLETELSVDEISQAVGYLASTSFSRKFKQATGLTPSQYREKHAAKD